MNESKPSPPTGSPPSHGPLRLSTRASVVQMTPAASPVLRAPDEIAALRAEYRRIKAERLKWRLLSLGLGGGGVLMILLVDPHEASAALLFTALVMFALGLMFAGKFKGRSLWWGFTALGRVRLFQRATEPDFLKERLEEIRKAIEAKGERV